MTPTLIVSVSSRKHFSYSGSCVKKKRKTQFTFFDLGVPYACRRTVIQSEQVSSEIFNQLVALIGEYKDYEHKVNMLKPFGEQTRMEKLLDSLRAHLFVSQEDEELFINAVKEIVMKDFVDAVEKDQSGSATSHKVEQEKEGGPVSTTSNTTSENVEKESGTTTMEKMDVDSSIV